MGGAGGTTEPVTGGATGSGGGSAHDASIADVSVTGGSTGPAADSGTLGVGGAHDSGARGTGGAASLDAGDSLDVPLDTDGKVSSGGVLGSGGTAHTGGIVGNGGATATGGTVGSGGVTDTGGTLASGGTTGTGGVAGSGGVTGTGGSSSVVLNCAAAVVPANGGTNGLVTDFSDWNSTSGTWGSSTGLNGAVYKYAGPSSSMNAPTVEGTPKGLHLAGTVAKTDYAGGGLGFSVCATVASFTRIQFDVYGSAAGCAIELQLQTFDQRPSDQIPAGGCNNTGSSACFNFPVLKQIVDSTTLNSTPQTVTKPLASFTNWSAANAAQVVGLQWQFTNTASGTGCTPNATFTNVKFLP